MEGLRQRAAAEGGGGRQRRAVEGGSGLRRVAALKVTSSLREIA